MPDIVNNVKLFLPSNLFSLPTDRSKHFVSKRANSAECKAEFLDGEFSVTLFFGQNETILREQELSGESKTLTKGTQYHQVSNPQGAYELLGHLL